MSICWLLELLLVRGSVEVSGDIWYFRWEWKVRAPRLVGYLDTFDFYQPNTTNPSVIIGVLLTNNITISDISPPCKTIIEDQFENICLGLQVKWDFWSKSPRIYWSSGSLQQELQQMVVVMIPLVLTNILLRFVKILLNMFRAIPLLDVSCPWSSFINLKRTLFT